MSDDAQGRVAVVTGGTGALGRWVVRRLLVDGFAVHVPWIAEGEAEALAAFVEEMEGGALAPGGALSLARADLTAPEGVDAFITSVTAARGRLDALVNLAGGFRAGPIEETDPAEWWRMLDVNATTAFLCSHAAVPHLKARGGRIVNVTALPALGLGVAGMSAYAPSKAAVLALTRSLAKELRSDRITVNALAPEILDTPANRAAMPDADTTRWVHPRDAAGVVAWLVGRESGVVTGSVLVLGVG